MWECDDCKMNQEDRILADNRSMELEARVEQLEDLLDETTQEFHDAGGSYDPELFTRIKRLLSERTTS